MACSPAAQLAPVDVRVDYAALHGDAAFTARERRLLGQALAGLAAEVGVLVDLDFAGGTGTLSLYRAESWWQRVAELDEQRDLWTLGYADRERSNAWLVADRLASDALFVRVAGHEVLHALGASDSDGGIMQGRLHERWNWP